jgi:hypothetical protein
MPNDANAIKSTPRGELRGATAIAEFRDEPVRQTYYALEQGRIPAWKEGKVWVTTVEAIAEARRRQEQRAIEHTLSATSV